MLARAAARGGCLRQPSREFGTICQNLSSRLRETQNFASRRRETPYFEPDPKLPRKMRARNILGHFWVKSDPKSTKNAKVACHFFPGHAFFRKKKRTAPTPKHMGFHAHRLLISLARLAWLALAYLACLASDRPRSPCLHQQ